MTATTCAPSARAQAMSRGVSPTTTVRSHGHGVPSFRPRRAPRERREVGAVLGVGSEPALTAVEVAPDPRARELQPRDRLEVAGHEREPTCGPRAARRGPRRAGRERSRSGRRARGRRSAAGGVAEGVEPVVDRARRRPRRAAGSRARSRCPCGPPPRPAAARPAHAPDLAIASMHRRRVLGGGLQQQRAVDVEEQQQGAGGARGRPSSALERRPPAQRCANAAIRRAAFSTSSSWTISTGECM